MWRHWNALRTPVTPQGALDVHPALRSDGARISNRHLHHNDLPILVVYEGHIDCVPRFGQILDRCRETMRISDGAMARSRTSDRAIILHTNEQNPARPVGKARNSLHQFPVVHRAPLELQHEGLTVGYCR